MPDNASPPAAPPTVEIPLSLIDPSPLNRKCADDDQGILKLAGSIDAEGLISPISVRALGDRYEIVCGERRWRAFRHLGRDYIPCFVISADDAKAQIIRITENLQRQDLTPMEQGDGVAALLSVNGNDYAEAAARLGYHESWVRRRAKLPNLIDAWRVELADPETNYARIRDSVDKLEEVALLPAETQAAALSESWFLWRCDTVAMMRQVLASHFRNLAAKPWTREWERRNYSSLRRCTACLKRSDREATLFADLHGDTEDGKDKFCLDPVCWQEKVVRWCTHLLAENPEALALWDGNMTPADKKFHADNFNGVLVEDWRWKDRAEGDQHGPGLFRIPRIAVVVGGARTGKLLDIWLYDDGKTEEVDEAAKARSDAVAAEREEQAAEAERRHDAVLDALPADYHQLSSLLGTASASYLLIWAVWFGLEPLRHYGEGEAFNRSVAAMDGPEKAWEGLRKEIAEYVLEYDDDLDGAEAEMARDLIELFGLPINTPVEDEVEEPEGDDDDAATAD